MVKHVMVFDYILFLCLQHRYLCRIRGEAALSSMQAASLQVCSGIYAGFPAFTDFSAPSVAFPTIQGVAILKPAQVYTSFNKTVHFCQVDIT